MAVNYNDERLVEVEADRQAALNEIDVAYGNMIGNADQYYNEAIEATKDYADKQAQIQQERTDFAIEQIEQQKEYAKQDYIKEQSGAYVDWQKQSNEFGVQAEQMAAMGMTGTGFNESSKVSMYNTYQNRVATAREAYTRAVLNYDNAIKDARLQNNAALAEIAYNALQAQLELSIEGFQYKNTLIMNQVSQKLAADSEYHNRYQDVLDQINTENALAEEIRQFNESLAEEQRQFNVSQANKGSVNSGGLIIDNVDNNKVYPVKGKYEWANEVYTDPSEGGPTKSMREFNTAFGQNANNPALMEKYIDIWLADGRLTAIEADKLADAYGLY